MITLQYDTTVDQLKNIRDQIEKHISENEDYDKKLDLQLE